MFSQTDPNKYGSAYGLSSNGFNNCANKNMSKSPSLHTLNGRFRVESQLSPRSGHQRQTSNGPGTPKFTRTLGK